MKRITDMCSLPIHKKRVNCGLHGIFTFILSLITWRVHLREQRKENFVMKIGSFKKHGLISISLSKIPQRRLCI